MIILKHKGNITISMAMAMIVFGMVMAAYQQDQRAEAEADAALIAGKKAGQYKQAVRAIVAQEWTGITPGTYTGTNWLKDSATCAGATGAGEYLPCDYEDDLPLGMTYTSTVSNSGGSVNVITNLGVPTFGSSDTRPSISGYVVDGINGSNQDLIPALSQVFYNAVNDPTTGNVSFTVTNSQENLIYLKADGTVEATGDFNWGGNDITNIGSLSANTISSTGDITSGGNISANQLSATGNISSGGTISGNQLSVTGGVNAGDLNSSGQTVSQSYIFSSSVSVGSSCSGRQINVDGSGNIVSCVRGVWTAPTSTPTTYSYNYSVANNGTYYMRAGESGKIIIRGTVHGRAGYASFGFQWLRLYVDNVQRQIVYSSNMEYDNRRSGVGMTVHYVLNTTPFRNVPVRLYRSGALEYGTMFLSGLGL